MKIYIAMKQGSDGGYSAPWIEVVAGKGYKTRAEAFAVIETDFESELDGASPDDVFEYYGTPRKKGYGKYGVAYFSNGDVTTIYYIKEIKISV